MIGAVVLAATLTAVKHFDTVESKRLVPLLTEAVAFPTVAGDTDARQRQQAWLAKTATSMGFVVRDAGLVTEIELPASRSDAPVLGLVVHGDVQPVDARTITTLEACIADLQSLLAKAEERAAEERSRCDQLLAETLDANARAARLEGELAALRSRPAPWWRRWRQANAA